MRSIRSHPLAFAACGAALLLVSACSKDDDGGGGGTTGPQNIHLEVAPDSVSIIQRDSVLLLPSALNDKGQLVTGVAVRFTSSNTDVLTVSATGWAKSVGRAGKAKVTVKGGGASVDVPVVVLGLPTQIELLPSPAVVNQKSTLQLQARVLDLNGDVVQGAGITYASTDESILTVSSTGLVTSVGPAGQAIVVATSGSLTQQIAVAVTQVPGSITVAPDPVSMGVNTTFQLAVQVRDLAGALIPNAPVTFSSSDQSKVTVSSTGLITSVGPLGTASVTVRVSPTLSKVVTVNVVTASHPQGTLVTPHVNISGDPFGAAISGNIVYVATLGGNLHRVDMSNGNAVSVANGVGGQQVDVATNINGSRVYVTGPGGGLGIVDAASGSLLASVGPVSGTPFDVVSEPNEATVYVSTGDGFVAFINPTTRAIQSQLNAGIGAIGHLALHPTASLLYGSSFDNGRVVEINTQTRTAVRSFTTGGAPQAMAVAPDGSELYVANENGNLNIITLATGAITTVSLGGCSGYGMVMTPDNQQLYVGCSNGLVKVLDRASRAVLNTINTGGQPRRMDVRKDGRYVVVANQAGWLDIIQ